MKRRYTDVDMEPHGTRELVRYYVNDLPDTRRHYGRALIRQFAATCPKCTAVDYHAARISRIRSAYRRRSA